MEVWRQTLHGSHSKTVLHQSTSAAVTAERPPARSRGPCWVLCVAQFSPDPACREHRVLTARNMSAFPACGVSVNVVIRGLKTGPSHRVAPHTTASVKQTCSFQRLTQSTATELSGSVKRLNFQGLLARESSGLAHGGFGYGCGGGRHRYKPHWGAMCLSKGPCLTQVVANY